MSEPDSSQHRSDVGAATFTVGGVAAAFAVASCCALPMLLASAGIGSAGLAGVAMGASPHRTLLLAVSALCLAAGAALLLRQQIVAARCRPGGACMSRPARVMTLVGLLAGAVLLWLGYTYV